jgi:hypothetical protein
VDPTLLKRVAECDAMLDTAVKQLQVEWSVTFTSYWHSILKFDH